jgi:hypothetical protein
MISARDLKDIIRDELYGLEYAPGVPGALSPDQVKHTAKTIVKRALLSPR